VKSHASNLGSVAAMLVDGGYTGEKACWGCVSHDRRGGTDSEAERASQICGDSETLCGGKEFCLAGHYRRLWKNCERKLDTSLQMTALAFVALLLKRWRC